MKVKLTGTEMMAAALAGSMRQVDEIRNGRSRFEGWSEHAEMAGAEMAVAKAAGVYFSPIREPSSIVVLYEDKAPDSVTLTAGPDPRCLYVLVAGVMPEYELVGAISGEEAMADGNQAEEGHYILRSKNLRPLGDFRVTPGGPS